MSSSKFAAIHGGLLVRKGDAAPAIRPTVSEVSYVDAERRHAGLPSVDGDAPAVQPGQSLREGGRPSVTDLGRGREPVSQRRPAEKMCATPASDKSPCIRPVPSAKRPRPARGKEQTARSKATVRLTEQQKHVMKLAAAALGRSQQQLISDAIDSYLTGLGGGEMSTCACFKQQLASL